MSIENAHLKLSVAAVCKSLTAEEREAELQAWLDHEEANIDQRVNAISDRVPQPAREQQAKEALESEYRHLRGLYQLD